ncbi:MAG: hypothetical protein IPN75_14460 [Dechloromonas sp.]|uniref:Uncharacterized protein n=1 Tax=Candidatus Dechloromonas phosphorivorans TaxID=2899244 RepID=A0A9D7LS73_9RHOO|nr:hypothetical protein [Candidatus Dechloromonas phosphorivorans]
MLHTLTRTLLVCALSLASSLWPASATEMSAQQAALGFAGLDAPATDPAHKAFQQRAALAWASYDKQVGQPLAVWSKREVAYAGGGTVFYPFSGPDFATVARVYPDAERYVLVAIQFAGQPARPENMNAVQRAEFERKFGGAWEKFGKLGYFRTVDLNDDQRDRASGVGTTTILMAFAARLGYEVTGVAPLSFSADKGEWEAASTETKSRSVRLFLQKAGRKATLDYVSLDLSDGALKAGEAHTVWIKHMAAQPVLLKAASHLLQQANFRVLRDALVAAAPIVVQDETGLDYKELSKIGPVRLYGKFSQAHPLFTTTTQPALAAAYRAEKSPGDLPFAFSYLKTADARSMQVVRRPPTN